MKKQNYETPQIEVIGIELEDAILSVSLGGDVTTSSSRFIDVDDYSDGGSAWDM